MVKYLIYYVGKTKMRVHIWEIIELAWLLDQALNPKDPRLKNITAEHIVILKCPKMRVKYAAQVMSEKMALWLEECATTGSE